MAEQMTPVRSGVGHRAETVLALIVALAFLAAAVAGVRAYENAGPRLKPQPMGAAGPLAPGQVRVLTVSLETTGGAARIRSVHLTHRGPGVTATFAVGDGRCGWGFADLSLLANCSPRPVVGASIGGGSTAGPVATQLIIEYQLTSRVPVDVPDVVVTYRAGWRTWSTALGLRVRLLPPA
jgi:hypothetical protein